MAELKLSAKASIQAEAIKYALKQMGSKGATIEEIKRTIKIEIPHRTLQRRIICGEQGTTVELFPSISRW